MGSVVKYDRTLFEPEHDLFRESYRAFLDRHVAPYHDQWEQDKIVDRGAVSRAFSVWPCPRSTAAAATPTSAKT